MPYRCQSRNHGLRANASSCLRFAAARSLGPSGLISGASNISCSCSMSSMMRSTSMGHNHLREGAERSTGNEVTWTGGVADRGGSRHAQTLERGASRSSTDVRRDDQFENSDIRELNAIFLDLACRVGWAEIPLLAHNFSKRVSAIRRPSQDKLLGTRCLGFLENERDATEPLRVIEEQPDRLSSRC